MCGFINTTIYSLSASIFTDKIQPREFKSLRKHFVDFTVRNCFVGLVLSHTSKSSHHQLAPNLDVLHTKTVLRIPNKSIHVSSQVATTGFNSNISRIISDWIAAIEIRYRRLKKWFQFQQIPPRTN
ncbi:hypothetical protein VIGAN_03191200 [Vigna angularis var. angularis]|uniref:Uncharacterized protein n=1 Tax=Vigna angularis var. angularis TaxID=157739 RepID=A0A0S3RNH9_PHAAN|nr:hypothetical protein VIGAN_03191200 [Vigna angularis var. angularis]